MNRSAVHIDAVRVRAKGVRAATGRGIADGLGEAIAEALAARGISRPGHPRVRIPEMNLGRMTVGGRLSAAIRAEIASRVADSVAGRMGSKG